MIWIWCLIFGHRWRRHEVHKAVVESCSADGITFEPVNGD